MVGGFVQLCRDSKPPVEKAVQALGNSYLTEHQFCQLLGRMRLYQSLPQGYQKDIPKMLITDSQINTVAKAYINDKNFASSSWE